MKKNILSLDKSLSIRELEERYELTIEIPSYAMEAAKDDNGDIDNDDCDGGIIGNRCGCP